MHAIQVTNLSKTYSRGWRHKGQQALQEVNLSIKQGTSFGLIGPNGAGKTTLVKTLLGVVRPTLGKLEVLQGDPEDPSVRRRIGYLPERLHFAPGATARSFLLGVARLKQIPQLRLEVRKQLGRVGLSSVANRRVSGFSKGMKQRLGLAAALLGQPDLLVLDEPTDGIDPIGRAEVRRMLKEECARGATILMNSHLLAETERSCDCIGILVQGKLVLEGSIDALCADHSRWLVSFDALNPQEHLLDLGFQKYDEQQWILAVADTAELNQTIFQAQNQGALLTKLVPYVRDLEEILEEVVGEEQP